MYIVFNPDNHQCKFPDVRWVNNSWCISLEGQALSEGAVIGCHVCGAEYKMGRDPLKAGEVTWEKQT